MAKCNYCKNVIPSGKICGLCGQVILGNFSCIVYYGATKHNSHKAEMTITNKYIIIRKVEERELAGNYVAAQFGMIGILVNAAVHTSRQLEYAYYDLSEFSGYVYPYHLADMKRKCAIKLITKEGKDIVIASQEQTFLTVKSVLRASENLAAVGIPKIDLGTAPNSVYCYNPLEDGFTFYRRLAPSAAVFLGYMPQPVDPQQVPFQQIPVQQIPVQQAPVQQAPQAVPAFCFKCGAPLVQGYAFCEKCGTKVIM